MDEYKKFELLNEVFSNGESFSYSDLLLQLKIAFRNQLKSDIGDNKCKELITYCKNQDWLKQEKPKAPYTLGQYTNNSISRI